MKLHTFRTKLNIYLNVFGFSKLIICYPETHFCTKNSHLFEIKNNITNGYLAPTFRAICKIPNYAI